MTKHPTFKKLVHLNFNFDFGFLFLFLRLRNPDVNVGVSHNDAESSRMVLTVLETSSCNADEPQGPQHKVLTPNVGKP